MPAETTHIKAVRKSLESIRSFGHQDWRIFEDWLGLMFYAFQGNDPDYLKIMDRYQRDNDRTKADGRDRPADYFAAATGALLAHMRQTNREALGGLYMEYAANHYVGQFFTPTALCEVMSAITMQGVEGPRNIADPCCGAGSQLIAACKQMSSADVDKSLFYGVDLDLNCARMTALNLMFFNLPGVVLWADTLRLEVRGGWYTHRSLVWGGSLAPMSLEDAEKWLLLPLRQKEPAPQSAKQTGQPRQLVLFDAPAREAA